MAEGSRRERWITFLLLPALVLSVLVLTGITFRSGFQLERLRERSVVEATLALVSEKVDRLDKRIVEQDAVLVQLMVPEERDVSSAEWLKIAARQTPTVRATLIVDLSAKDQPVISFASRSAAGPEDERFRRLLIRSILPELKLEPPRGELRHLHRSFGDQSYLVSYWQRDADGRRYLVVAWHDVARIVHELFPSLAERGDRQQSRVNVVDEEGRIVFGPPLSRGGLTVGRAFDSTLYKWTVNVSLSASEELAEAAARRRVLEMSLVGLSAAVTLGGLVVILLALARERKLAHLKSDFIANVSHELKTPLSLVRMFGELLQSGRVDTEAKRQQYLQIIVSESERLGALIENVLDFAKVERGHAGYEFSRRQVGEVLARAVDACHLRADREGKRLVLDVAPDLPPANLDERAIEIAVINLIDNALKYAPDGEQVTITARERGGFIEVRVIDQGPGIAPEDRRRIFERFVRGKSAAGRQVRGSGIGLALVKHIAEAHGGSITVESPGLSGSEFVLSFRSAGPPRARPSAARVEEP